MRRYDFSNAVLAGLIGGLIFLILEMLMVPLFMEGSPWGPPRMIAAIVMGEGVLPPPADFNFGIFLVTLIVHFVLSVIYALILTAIVRAMTMGMAVITGAVFGLVLYLINFYGFTAVFPWFAEARNWVTITAHIVFGIVTAWAYVGLTVQEPRAVV